MKPKNFLCPEAARYSDNNHKVLPFVEKYSIRSFHSSNANTTAYPC
jgi:hypothetical protein